MLSSPNVFIMSSSPGLNLAKALALVLARDKRIDVKTWSDAGDFREGDTFIDTLRRTTIQYDFGISILTPDDASEVRGRSVTEPRDNVLFEFGLFLGARGRHRAFPVVVETAKAKTSIPTDIQGVKHFSVRVADLNRSVEELLPEVEVLGEAMAARMLQLYKEPEITILPSTGLAIGYFHNFILPVFKSLEAKREALTWTNRKDEGTTVPVDWTQVEFHVCIPEDLADATKEHWASKGNALGLATAEVDPPPDLPRAYPFRITPMQRTKGVLKIYDAPTTLLAARHAVRWLIRGGSYTTEDQLMADEKEVHNFQRTIQALLRHDDYERFERQVRFVGWGELK